MSKILGTCCDSQDFQAKASLSAAALTLALLSFIPNGGWAADLAFAIHQAVGSESYTVTTIYEDGSVYETKIPVDERHRMAPGCGGSAEKSMWFLTPYDYSALQPENPSLIEEQSKVGGEKASIINADWEYQFTPRSTYDAGAICFFAVVGESARGYLELRLIALFSATVWIEPAFPGGRQTFSWMRDVLERVQAAKRAEVLIDAE